VSQSGRFGLRLDRAGQAASTLGPQGSVPPRPGTMAFGQNPGPTPVLFSFSFRLKKNPSKCVKLQKIMENKIKLPKCKINFFRILLSISIQLT
jgi:hypothetical protein